jgi:hypothetical protein
VHAELDAAGLSSSSGGGRAFEASDVAKLPYLANVIKEAMRINSAVPQVNRWVAMIGAMGGVIRLDSFRFSVNSAVPQVNG